MPLLCHLNLAPVYRGGERQRCGGPGDPGSGIEDLLADKAELALIGERNIEKARLYDATHMADAYETLYREIEAQV